MNTAELSLSGDGSVSEFDSLTVECNKWCMDRNEFVNSYKDERHWWGNNNLNILSIVEVKGWENDLKLNKRSVELFEENSDIPEKREAFSDALNKYFTAMHSNEIYIEIVFNK